MYEELVQSKKCNEINKTAKTQDELRKEIELRVAAAKVSFHWVGLLLQQPGSNNT